MKLREIAARLREAASSAPACKELKEAKRTRGGWIVECECDRESLREFRFGSLVIRCRNADAHIRAVADKYDKGLRGRGFQLAGAGPSRPTLRRPADGPARLAELLEECGELLEEVAA